MDFAEIRQSFLALTRLILIQAVALSMTGPTEALAADTSTGNGCSAHCANAPPMNQDSDTDDIRQLVRTLGDAYENSLLHDKPNADLEAKDLGLESASIQLSSHILAEVTKASCRSGKDEAKSECALDAESSKLRDLTDMLSYAAFRLENLARSSLPRDRGNGQRAIAMARLESMEHLYRMAFAVSKIYLDRSQSGVYVHAAQQELRSARESMEMERDLCACDLPGSDTRLLELSQLENHLKEFERQQENR